MRVKFLLFVLLVFVLSGFVFAQSVHFAKWVSVPVKFNWDRSSVGFCASPSQCLVDDLNNESFDNLPERYFSFFSPGDLPKCINNRQFILDFFCDNGVWTSRTNLVAQQLLAIAFSNSRNDFSLYCDSFNNSLNRFDYVLPSGSVLPLISDFCDVGSRVGLPCVNNFCVLNYAGNVAFGTSLNTPVDQPHSFLKALNKSQNFCDNAINNNGRFDFCGDGIWYNHDTLSVLYAPGLVSLPAVTSDVKSFFGDRFNEVSSFVFSSVHNPPRTDYSFFNTSLPLFNRVFFSQKADKFVFGFKEEKVTPDLIDFAGWDFHNVGLSSDFCFLIELFNGRCGSFANDVFVVGKKSSAAPCIVDFWQDLSGKLRLS